MLRPVPTAPASRAIVTTAEVKQQCVIDHSDDDTLIDVYINAVYDRLSGHSGILGRCILNQTWRIDLTDWPVSRCIRLPFPDVSSITSVKYFDSDNNEQTVTSTDYQLIEDELSSVVRLIDTFDMPAVYDDRLDGVQVTFVAGYGATAADVPDSIRVAALLMTCDMYENRSNVEPGMGSTEIPMPANSVSLLEPYRRSVI